MVKNTKEYIHTVLTILFLILILVGCKKDSAGKEKKEEPIDNEEKKALVSEEYEEFFTSIGPNEILWICDWAPMISAESQKKINQILQEKGIDYQIRFLVPKDANGSVLVGEKYTDWVTEYGKKGVIDIVFSGVWEFGSEGYVGFVKNEMAPLNSYLETTAGLRLKETYTDDEWKQCSIEGKTYVVPYAVNSTPVAAWLDNGIYIAVNDDYSAYFSGFDGTYASLREIFKRIGNNDLRIVLSGTPGKQMLFGLMGCSYLHGILPFRSDEGRVIDITKSNELYNLLMEIYEDYESGILINPDWASEEVPKERVLAYIRLGKRLPIEGFTEYCSAKDLYEFNPRGKYGISAYSNKKEQALQVLSECLSDTELLCLFYAWGDKELIQRRKELLASNPKSEWAGVFVSIGEKPEGLNEYDDSLSGPIYSMRGTKDYDDEGFSIYGLNPEYDLDAEWKKFIEETGSFSSWCESANKQIQEWSHSLQ